MFAFFGEQAITKSSTITKSRDLLRNFNFQTASLPAQSKPADLAQIANLIDNGKVKPVIAKILTLDNAKEAQELSEKGHVAGKIVLKVG